MSNEFVIWFFETFLSVKLLVCILIFESLFHRLAQVGFTTKLSEISKYYSKAYVFARTPFKLAALEILQTEEELKIPLCYSVSRS